MLRKILAIAAFAGLAIAAHPLAANELAENGRVELSRAVFLERASATPSGLLREIKPAQSLRRGDKVILMVEWRANTHSKGFTVASPVPQDLSFARSSDDSLEVSVDGGRNWGPLDTIRKGARKATPEDVTHLRWRIPAHKARRGAGRITYSAFVR